jgi:cobalt/nickel transport system permease protein
MQTLRVPDKLSSLFFFVAKFVIIIKDEFNTTKKVMKVRNFRAKSNVFSYKIYANVIGMMIVKCFDKAEKLKNTMILRNFQGKIYQSKSEKITKLDLVILGMVILSLSIKFGEISL